MIVFTFVSDKGKVKEKNEDFYGFYDNELFLIADGLGGYKGGEIASRLAVEVCLAEYKRIKLEKLSPQKTLKRLVSQAHFAVNQRAKQLGFLWMSTTLIIVMIKDNHFTIANVGDSRVYLIQSNLINQITIDQETDFTGLLLQAVGLGEKVKPDLYEGSFRKESLLLLCTDGLTDFVSDRKILELIDVKAKTKKELNKSADQLITLANNRGGFDNITVGLIKNV